MGNDIGNRMEPDSTVYKTLLESTKAIPWKIDWQSMTFAYIGPQIEAVLGWSPSSWVGVQDWADRMHPDDRGWVVDFCVAQSQAGTDHEADYRALTSGGDYVWIRDVVHVVRNEAGDVVSTLHRECRELESSDPTLGARLQRPLDQPLPSTRKMESVHHFVEMTVSAGAIQMVAKRDDGSVLDRCGLVKATDSWDCDRAPPAASVA